MSYPDWVPMWLRTAMGRKCEDLAELAVPVTMAVDGQERFTMAAFGPIAWRVPDGCGEPKGEMGLNRTRSDCRVADFVTCKHRPNARALLHRSYGGIVSWIGAESFDARCMDAVVAQYPKARWSLPFVAQYLCAFDGEPAEDLGNLVAIVRSHGKHFDVKSKRRAGLPDGAIVLAEGRSRPVDMTSRPVIYDVNTLAKAPAMRATWVGPVVRFEFKEARFVPKLGEVFRVGFDPLSRWKAQQQERDCGDTWIDARLVADDYPNTEYDPAVVGRVVTLIGDEMRQSKRHEAERAKTPNVYETVRAALHAADLEMSVASALSGAVGKAAPIIPGTVSPGERDAKTAPPSIMVSLPKAKPGESLWLKWSTEAGALLTNANGESVGGVEQVPSTLCARDGAKAEGASATALGSPQAGIFLTPDVTSDGPKTLHIPLSLMAGLATSIYFDEHRIGAAARLEMPAVSIAFVEIDGLTFRLTGDRTSPNDAGIALLDLVPVEGPSRDRNDELAAQLFDRVNRANRLSEPPPLPELGPDDISEWRILGSSEMMLRVHRYPTLQHVSIWSSRHNLSVCGVGVVATQVTAADGAAIGIHIDLETSGEALRRALALTSYAEMNLDSAHALEGIICSAKQPGQRFHEVRVVKDWTRVEDPCSTDP